MRRSEREVTDSNELERIILEAQICHLALSVDDQPYVIPLNFGYESNTIYLHTATRGQKLDLLAQNPKVCLSFALPLSLVKKEKACGWSQRYESVVATGVARIVQDPAERVRGLDTIMRHYGGPEGPYGEAVLQRTCIIAIDLGEVSGKAHLGR